MTDTADITLPIDTLFVGAIGTLEGDGSDSGIHKQAVDDARWLDAMGVAGDEQADRVHHGGPDRALNHYPAEHYAHWRERYPDRAAEFVPGAFGENISTRGLTEAQVHVGDVFSLGEATIQIAQPRQPCWKIGARTGVPKLAGPVASEARAGWLYRVLEAGPVRAGDTLARIERAAHGITLADLWAAYLARQPDDRQREALHTLAGLDTLAAKWRDGIARRIS